MFGQQIAGEVPDSLSMDLVWGVAILWSVVRSWGMDWMFLYVWKIWLGELGMDEDHLVDYFFVLCEKDWINMNKT